MVQRKNETSVTTNRPRHRELKNRRRFLKTTGLTALALVGIGGADATSAGKDNFKNRMSELTDKHGQITDVIPEQVGTNRYRVVYIFENGRQPVFFNKLSENELKITVDSKNYHHEVTPEDRNSLQENLDRLEARSERSVARRGRN